MAQNPFNKPSPNWGEAVKDDKTIIEGNKQIHIFYKGFKGEELEMWQVRHLRYFDHLQYHKSWDLLMPVVEKIEWLDSKDIDCRITIERQECRIYFDNGNEKYERLMGSRPKIETVWHSIVSFLTWYNSQYKTNNNGHKTN